MNSFICVLQDLYRSEINFSLSSFWDAGYTIALGDEMNGFKGECMIDYLDCAADEIVRMAIMHYPESDFAKKYAVNR